MIKSIVKEKENYQRFPYLGISKTATFIVLFTGINNKEKGTTKGIVVYIKPEIASVFNYNIGDYMDSWFQNQFKPYSGIVCLSNDKIL